ncbi:Na(+)-translocating NADH-quinone reductase subunit C [Candidatus Poribacteria bacterium]|nr:Na(+)-translocating NADH-quinone reductase subunit C [Candidatus Poribacteria bacterium]MDP6597413.1 Na(+)-translocating NADH-quinone reductase subunit C [Candidatus Poribacteria bacterium]MDP6750780.1 Na(+)-translocating NADH-quinone reductase subunit C [Candidatus Poribacteria bacterium]MDP6997548.1 Na(+)-translocating NADH-quinone reductase subunit C [Candidatus Poribacteria bacterium]
MQVNSWYGTIIVAFLLCLVCSVVVSTTAVKLKEEQKANVELDIKRNLLLSSGLITDKKASRNTVEEKFKNVETKVVDLETGQYVENSPQNFDARKAAKDPKMSVEVPSPDKAKIKNRSKWATVYLIEDGGVPVSLVLPVSGYGLWSTLYGFLTLDADTRTVKGLGFYEHAETPGLGGEVDNPKWKAQWNGKVILDKNYQPNVRVEKNGNDKGKNSVDALSGATITSRGVENLLHYWLGDHGYGPFLAEFRKGEI